MLARLVCRRRTGKWFLGALCILAPVALPQAALAVGSAYVGNYISDTTSQFDIGAGGTLVAKTPATVMTGNGPFAIAISADGADFYIANGDAPGVGQFDIGAGGLLSPMTPAQVAAGSSPQGIAISPDGSSVYATNHLSANISQYDVGAGGVLTPKTPPTVAAGNMPWSISISPDGSSVYVGNFSGASISQYDVGAGGVLTPKTPATVATGTQPFFSAVSPDGTSLYVTSFGIAAVSQYDIGAGGLLSPKTPPTVPAGANPAGVTISPDGRNAYVGNSGGASVSQYDVGAGGLLTPKTPPTIPAGVSPGQLTVSPDGVSVYAANFGSNSISLYDRGADGLLAAKTTPTVPVGSNPRWIALVPNQGPTASFTATTATLGSATTFDASGSNDPDGTVAGFSWDFGDGNTTADGGPSLTHTYTSAGTYTATLTVTDNEGCSSSFVFTGQYASCNGGPAGLATRTVTVPERSFGTQTRVTLRLAKKRIPGKGPVPVRVINGNDFQVTGKLGGRKGRVRLKRKSVNVAANARQTVRLKLPKRLRTVLVRRHKLSVVLRLRVKDPAGSIRTVKKKVVPKLKRKRR